MTPHSTPTGDIRVLFSPEQCRHLNRCLDCGWHPATQGHHPHCPCQQPPTQETK